jgi:hypothetical protein
LIYDFDSQALTPALPNEHGFQFAALDTLQHRLPRNAEFDFNILFRKSSRPSTQPRADS